MIYLWLKAALIFLAKLIIPPQRTAPFPSIDPSEQCPACGHRGGKIKCVAEGPLTVVQHLCNQCSARWNSATVVQTNRILGANK